VLWGWLGMEPRELCCITSICMAQIIIVAMLLRVILQSPEMAAIFLPIV
jgi:hypothetical protein